MNLSHMYQVAGSLIGTREAAIRAAIESWAGDTPPSEWTEDQIREWLPGWCEAPEGVDQAELDAEVVQTAIAMMHAAVKPRAVRCECGHYTGERCIWIGSPDDMVVVEYMPMYLRASHEAARNVGVYPYNGAIRIWCERSCAESIVENDPDWAWIVE